MSLRKPLVVVILCLASSTVEVWLQIAQAMYVQAMYNQDFTSRELRGRRTGCKGLFTDRNGGRSRTGVTALDVKSLLFS